MINHYPKMAKAVLLVLALLTPTAGLQAQGRDSVRSMSANHRAILQRWLGQHSNLRLATEADCGHCRDDLTRIRRGDGDKWKPLPNYQPYYAAGDFNGDGAGNFAVALVDDRKPRRRFAVAIFNGSLNQQLRPAFFRENFDLSGSGFAFGPPHPKPYRLIVGPFESDNTIVFTPRGKTYVAK